MSEMIERVARAAATADWRVEINEYSEPARWDQAKDAYDLTNNNGRARYDNIARAAIEAMRMPTSDMLQGEPCMYRGTSYMVPVMDIWPQMIDAALKSNVKVG